MKLIGVGAEDGRADSGRFDGFRFGKVRDGFQFEVRGPWQRYFVHKCDNSELSEGSDSIKVSQHVEQAFSRSVVHAVLVEMSVLQHSGVEANEH